MTPLGNSLEQVKNLQRLAKLNDIIIEKKDEEIAQLRNQNQELLFTIKRAKKDTETLEKMIKNLQETLLLKTDLITNLKYQGTYNEKGQ